MIAAPFDSSGADATRAPTLVHDSQQRRDIQARIESLRAERIQFDEEKHRADDALGRATLDGVDDIERKKLRSLAVGFAIRVQEIDNALRLSEGDLKGATERAGRGAIADAGESMERARSEFVAAVEELERIAKELAPAILPAWDKYLAARHQCFESQGRYARVVADDFVYDRASARDLPIAITPERGEVLFAAAHAMVTLAGREVFGRPVMMAYEGGK